LTSTSVDAAGVAEVVVAEPVGEFRGVAAVDQRGGQAARPQLIRALNEQLLLGHIRQLGPCSRAELARLSGLSKPTVSLALANLERSGLIRIAGQRTGVPGRSARLFEISPDAGFVLGLDIGHHYLRGALADLTGEIRAKNSARTRASSVRGRIAELIRLADTLCADAGIARDAITQTVIGSPGVYDPRRGAMALTGGLSGLSRPAILAGLRDAFGDGLVIENDVDAAALAERAHGHGSDFASFAFVWIGTGIGLGLVLDGRLHRGAHGVAGEIAYMPISEGEGADEQDARRRGTLEAAGRGCADRSRRAASSPPRPRATSAPWRWWQPRRASWPRRSAPWSPSSIRNSSCWAVASGRPPGSRPR
jgi:DNA-binding transcriptional ArsR family regulator